MSHNFIFKLLLNHNFSTHMLDNIQSQNKKLERIFDIIRITTINNCRIFHHSKDA